MGRHHAALITELLIFLGGSIQVRCDTALNPKGEARFVPANLLEKAGLPQIRLYDLRHSHATLLLVADEHLKVVSERLGHSTIRLTADTYSHVLESMQQGTASKLESMLYGT
jgi:integrase